MDRRSGRRRCIISTKSTDLPPVLFHESDEYYRPEEKQDSSVSLNACGLRGPLNRTYFGSTYRTARSNGIVRSWSEVDVNGQLVHMHGLLQDITDEMMARTRLKEEQVFFQSVLDSIPADIAVCSEDQRYLYINRPQWLTPRRESGSLTRTTSTYFTMRGLPLDRAYKRQAQFRSMLEERKKFFEEHSVGTGRTFISFDSSLLSGTNKPASCGTSSDTASASPTGNCPNNAWSVPASQWKLRPTVSRFWVLTDLSVSQ